MALPGRAVKSSSTLGAGSCATSSSASLSAMQSANSFHDPSSDLSEVMTCDQARMATFILYITRFSFQSRQGAYADKLATFARC